MDAAGRGLAGSNSLGAGESVGVGDLVGAGELLGVGLAAGSQPLGAGELVDAEAPQPFLPPPLLIPAVHTAPSLMALGGVAVLRALRDCGTVSPAPDSANARLTVVALAVAGAGVAALVTSGAQRAGGIPCSTHGQWPPH